MAKSRKRGLSSNLALDVTKQKEFQEKVQAAKQKKAEKGTSLPGVVYISRLPWGFEEESMKSFFSQFGDIEKLRISRSKKTGNSRGYAYIQFANDEVAKIVAETMNNYLMFEKLIKCKYLGKPHPETFRNAGKTFQPYKAQERSIVRHNSTKGAYVHRRNATAAIKKCRKKLDKLAALGIDYKFDSFESLPNQKTVKTETPEVKEEIFSDDNTEVSGRKKGKRKIQTGDDSGVEVIGAEKTSMEKKSTGKTEETDIVSVSDEETDIKKKKLKTKIKPEKKVSDSRLKDLAKAEESPSHDLPEGGSVTRKLPQQGKKVSKPRTGGKKQLLKSQKKKS